MYLFLVSYSFNDWRGNKHVLSCLLEFRCGKFQIQENFIIIPFSYVSDCTIAINAVGISFNYSTKEYASGVFHFKFYTNKRNSIYLNIKCTATRSLQLHLYWVVATHVWHYTVMCMLMKTRILHEKIFKVKCRTGKTYSTDNMGQIMSSHFCHLYLDANTNIHLSI